MVKACLTFHGTVAGAPGWTPGYSRCSDTTVKQFIVLWLYVAVLILTWCTAVSAISHFLPPWSVLIGYRSGTNYLAPLQYNDANLVLPKSDTQFQRARIFVISCWQSNTWKHLLFCMLDKYILIIHDRCQYSAVLFLKDWLKIAFI